MDSRARRLFPNRLFQLPIRVVGIVMRRELFQRSCLASLAWGLCAAILVCRHFFSLGAGEFFSNHDVDGYGLRLIEFRDCLANGYLFPQWCMHFRSGLGSPFFTFYQSGFFYMASLTPWWWSIPAQIGAVVLAVTVVGYLGMYGLIGSRFGTASGVLAGTALLSSLYVYTELYVRGDYSEYAAMMFVPAFLHGLMRFAESHSKAWGCLASICGAMIVMTHPVVALFTYGALTVLIALTALRSRDGRLAMRALTIVAISAGLSAVYWVPLFVEMPLVSGANAWSGNVMDGYYHFSRHFIPLTWCFSFADTPTPIPVKLGPVHLFLAAVGAGVTARHWKTWSSEQRRIWVLCSALLAGSLFLMTPQSFALWEYLPLLKRAQFPWRLLTLVSIALAGLCGLSVSLIRNRRGAAVISGACCLVLIWTMVLGRKTPEIIHVSVPTAANEIADRFFSPDIAGEWVPRGAQVLSVNSEARKPVSSRPVTIRKYVMEQGQLLCELDSAEEAVLILPHYYYPRGFSASLNGVSVAMDQSPQGLMRVQVPAGFSGELRVIWSTTPAKWYGVAISVVVALTGIVVLLRQRVWQGEQKTLDEPAVRKVTATECQLEST